MKRLYLIFFLFFLFTKTALADSSYVLPYPSAMPGNSLYKLHVLYEKLSRYWYFGDFGQFKFSLRYADKYLVEAKILFEYKQYLLGYSALDKSNLYFQEIPQDLKNASENGKNISEKEALFREARERHVEVLKEIKTKTPKIFNWQPENDKASILLIHELIDESVAIRSL